MTATVDHFLTLLDYEPAQLQALIDRAAELKAMHRDGRRHQPLAGKTLAMIFEKSSTRTRVSFEAAMAQLGGHALFLSPRDTQLGRGEPPADTIRVLSRMVDAIMLRNDSHSLQEELAKESQVPLINGLSDRFHPCQLLADILTWQEARGAIAGATAAWIGDGNNVCHSWMLAARQWGFTLRVGCPAGYLPDADIIAAAGDAVQIVETGPDAAHQADVIVTDVWASMGQEQEQKARAAAFADWQVDDALMGAASKDALFMHCLPAHRGEEVSASVIDGPQSVVWEEAENRLHGQKALLEQLLS